jgi:two-component system, NtrC family, sensor histidine kinase HydH
MTSDHAGTSSEKKQMYNGGLSRLAAALSHEIKNPLSSIDMQIQLLQEQIENVVHHPERDKLLKHTQVISREIRRLLGILDGFSTYSKRPKLNKRKCDLKKEIDTLLDLIEPDASERNVVIRSDVCPELPFIECDSEQIRQVLLNLILNAFQAMPTGGDISIHVSFDEIRGQIVCNVRDSGTGIDPRHSQEIFEPFFTSKHEGTGLGLPIARKIIQEHGGEIVLAGTGSDGTTIQITLPAGDRNISGNHSDSN